MFNNYLKYLEFISEKLDKFFSKQKDYIFCKKGCGLCCKNAQFPYSKIEMQYLLSGCKYLSTETLDTIEKNIAKIAKDKENFKGEKFLYDCPFLIDNVCSIYNYRGIICRSFGLMSIIKGADKKTQVPFCYANGLNYSNVIDPETKQVSGEKYRQTGIKEEPLAFNVSYEYLTGKDFEESFNFTFGKKKPMIEWFLEAQKEALAQETVNNEVQ